MRPCTGMPLSLPCADMGMRGYGTDGLVVQIPRSTLLLSPGREQFVYVLHLPVMRYLHYLLLCHVFAPR